MQQNETKISAAPSLISSDLTIDGNLSCQGAIQIDGIVTGDIDGKSLVIGKGAEVTGLVTAGDATVHGKMRGEIRAKTVQIMSTGEMTGDIVHQSLAVEAGAMIEGNLRRMDLERTVQPVQAQPVQAQPMQSALAALKPKKAPKGNGEGLPV